jgi:hypothetical protein
MKREMCYTFMSKNPCLRSAVLVLLAVAAATIFLPALGFEPRRRAVSARIRC